MANTQFLKAIARAKQIRKANPKKKWTDCVKQAHKDLKAGKVSGIRKPAAKKAAPKKVARVKSVKTTKTKTVRLAGVGAMATRDLSKTIGDINSCEKMIQGLRDKMKGTKGAERNLFTRMINEQKKYLSGLKQRKTIIKRSI